MDARSILIAAVIVVWCGVLVMVAYVLLLTLRLLKREREELPSAPLDIPVNDWDIPVRFGPRQRRR